MRILPHLLIACLVAGPAGAAECPDPGAELQSVESDIVSFFLSDAETSLVAAVDAFACSRPATTEEVARLLLAKGMILRLQEDLDGSSHAFASARGIDPRTFNEDYGDGARVAWEAAAAPEGKPARVDLRNLGAAEKAWVDGAPAAAIPLVMNPGLHLLQAGGDVPRFARLMDVEAGQELTVTMPAIAIEAAEDGAVSTGIAKSKKNFVPAIAFGAASAALYGGSVGTRLAYQSNPSDAGFYAVDGLYGASIATGVTAAALAVIQLVKK